MYEGLKNTLKHKSSPDQGNSDGGIEATETQEIDLKDAFRQSKWN